MNVINKLNNIFATTGSDLQLPPAVGPQGSGKSSSLETLIPVINKLQDVFTTIGSDSIQLPQIVVVGAQSSGKSSVLESLVGKSFLPRGIGTVTRCPLILQLIYSPLGDKVHRSKENGTLDLEEWGYFQHKPNEIFQDFDEIRREIEKKTEEMAGSNKGIVNDPINLKIISKSVINLTVVDLPGIVKVPAGDQPEDIEDQIKKLIGKFIENPNSIILAVSPANNDMATSESIKMARRVDPDGLRTLVIVTKLDLMDAGTDAHEMLTGKAVPVRLGIIGVVNRSQQDIIDDKSIEEALKDEAKFLLKKYPGISAKNGTPFLGFTLNKLLMKHIRDCLPQLKKRVIEMKGKYKSILDTLGQELDEEDKFSMILKIVNKFASAYAATIDGTSPSLITKLCGAAQICQILHEDFSESLDMIDLTSKLPDKDISIAIRNANGLRPALFIPDLTFELMVKKQIENFQGPVLDCVDAVYEELERMIRGCGFAAIEWEMKRFPKLHGVILSVVADLLATRVAETKLKVTDIVNSELAYINTRHPEFQTELRWLIDDLEEKQEYHAKAPIKCKPNLNDSDDLEDLEMRLEKLNSFMGPGIPSSPVTSSGDGLDKRVANERRLKNKEKNDCRIIKELTKAYMLIVIKSIRDTVPKAIMNFLVNYIKNNLQNELNKIGRNVELLAEDEGISQKRKEVSDMLQALEKARRIISEI